MKTLLAALLVLFSLVGCATTSDKLEAKLVDAQIAAAARPTLQVKCPSGGCDIIYNDPRDRGVGLKMPTNGWDALINVTGQAAGLAQSAIVPGVMGMVAVKGFQAIRDTNHVTTTTTTTSTSNVGDNSGTSSGNTGKLAGADVIDSTHTPTVVTQPAPTVVIQPAPLIVTQPAPIIVQPQAVP